jgi:Fe-S cluster biogenesis protein NfuA
MTTQAQNAILVYTEATPNPETLKFVTNKVLLPSDNLDFPDEEAAQNSPLAAELFAFPFVQGVFIADNFVTITKTQDVMWQGIIPSLRDFIKEYVSDEKPIVDDQWYREKKKAEGRDDSTGDEAKIKEVLEKYVKPAVQMDGGAIVFKSYEDGIVKLDLKGACSGCPSSMVTLKAGIEGLLKRMVPEVKSVEATEA